LDIIAQVIAFAMSAKTKIPYKQCLDIVEYDQREHSRLDKLGARCANQYLPPEWLDKADLWIFLTTLVSITAIKVKTVMDTASKTSKKEVDVALDQIERATAKDEKKNKVEQKEIQTLDIPLEFTSPPPSEEFRPGRSFEDAA
jgi:hypothetical protein